MAECIDRQKAIDSLLGWAAQLTETYGKNDEYVKCLESAAYNIEQIPAADVRPVCHGRWVKARGSWCTPGGDPVWECSECGKGTHVYGIEHGTYGADVADGQWVSCPNCGAMMEES